MITAIRIRFYEGHHQDAPVYSEKAYDYLSRFKVAVGTPVVVESAQGLNLAKVVAIDVNTDKATKHVVGVVNTNPEG